MTTPPCQFLLQAGQSLLARAQEEEEVERAGRGEGAGGRRGAEGGPICCSGARAGTD